MPFIVGQPIDTANRATRPPAVLTTAAVIVTACAAWISQATLALATPAGPRIGVMPLSWRTIVVSVGAAALVFAAARLGGSLVPVSLLAFVLLPWLPLPVPDVFLVWAGNLRLLIWLAVVLLVLAPPWARWRRPGSIANLARTRPRLVAGGLSLVIFGGSAWAASPSVPGGDEPHYLVITQSLLFDGDLKIENNHLRGDYQPYFQGQLRPDFIRRGRDGQIYSIHAPGISAVVAPAFAIGGYPAVVLYLIALAAIGGALLWHVAWLALRSEAAAWFGWAAVTLSATTIFHAFTVYPDSVGGLLVLTGIWALLRAEDEHENGSMTVRPWLLHGAALSLLPWLHTRFALLAGSLGALLLLRISTTKNPAAKGVAFLVVPVVSALCWVGYFIGIYGVADPSAPYGTTREFSAVFIPGGLAGLLFDQRFGLLANAPVLICGVAGLVVMLRGRAGMSASWRLAAELLFIVVPYLLTVTNYAMWWGGWSAPARFAAIVVPAFGVPCGAAWAAAAPRVRQVLCGGALALTAFISAVLLIPQRGRLAFNTREGYALWLDWASQVADLGRGVPVWFRDREPQFFSQIALWTVVVLVAVVLVRSVIRRGTLDASMASTAACGIVTVAGMIAVHATWRLGEAPQTSAAPAQLQLLRDLGAQPRNLAVVLDPPSRVGRDDLARMLRIEPGTRYASVGSGARRDRPLLALPAVPAGRYRIHVQATAPGGWLLIGIAQDQFSLRTEPLSEQTSAIDIEFPVDVRALIVGADELARQRIVRLSVEPLSTQPSSDKADAGFARRAVRYGNASVFFMDERSFPEPEAFWIGGARESTVVVQPDVPGEAIRLSLRNAPVANRVTITAGSWREVFDLGPGEEREASVPVDQARQAAAISIGSRAGFRPSEMEQGSRDDRFLGVWVRLQNLATPPK
jgi:hypothetical protein